MKVDFISYSDIEGGAARAQHTLITYMNRNAEVATMHALKIKSDGQWIRQNPSVLLKIYSYISPFLNKLFLPSIDKKYLGKWSSFYVPFSPFSLARIKNDKAHLHWVAGGMMNLSKFKKRDVRLFVTLHDVWFYTAGCHINYRCSNYLHNCKNCPHAVSRFGQLVADFNFFLKRKFIDKCKPVFIAPSEFIYNQAKKSSLLGCQKILLVPNIVNFEIFKPIDKKTAKKILGLDVKAFYILFVGKNLHSDDLKGFKRFVDIAQKLYYHHKDIKVLIVGSSNAPEIMLDSKCFGVIEDQLAMNLIYSAADLMINTSLFESFGLTALESIASGTPVVGYNSGGTSDIIKNNISGFLLNDIEEVTSKILELNKRSRELERLSKSCSLFAREYFNPDLIAEKIIEIYENN